MSKKPRPWKFPRVKTAIFNGRRYKLLWRAPRVPKKEKLQNKRRGLFLYGLTSISPPHKMHISMDRKLHATEYDLFSTLLHECVHAGFPQQDESSVVAFEQNFVELLQRMKLEMKLP